MLRETLKDPEKFNNLMHEVDNQMRQNDIRIQGRVLEAMSIISKKYKCSIMLDSAEGNQINEWFKSRYGDRLKINFDIGATVVDVRGDLYKVSLHLVLGMVKVNVFEWIDDITPNFLNSLTKKELDIVAKQIIDHYQIYSQIRFLPKECTTDLDIAVEQLMRQTPEYGLSKWASLQAAEKTLKAYIVKKGGFPPNGGKDAHNLSVLSSMAENLGLPAIDKTAINSTQCSPKVRYDNITTKLESYTAYCAALVICDHVAKNFGV